MPPLLVGSEDLYRAVSFTQAIEALEAAFGTPTLPDTPQRSVLKSEYGQLLLMPAWGPEAAGVKLVTVAPGNPHRGLPLIQGVYVLFAPETLEPVAIFEAASLTALRTAAVSALATKHLSSPDAGRLLVFGAGVQAEAHVLAISSVRRLTDVAIVGRTPSGAAELVERLATRGVAARVGSPNDVAEADLVCTCTTSREPVFDGSLLPPGSYVNAVGAHDPSAREVDSVTVRRAHVVVETRSAALTEAGDLLIPLGLGEVDPARVPAAELAEIVTGARSARGEVDITLFKSVGVAFEDLAVARFAYEQIRT